MKKRHAVKVTFDNGDHLLTEINGTEESVREYYRIGKVFNIGVGEHDKMQRVAEVEFLIESPGHFMHDVIKYKEETGCDWSQALAANNVD